jgi:hypothetical protein
MSFIEIWLMLIAFVFGATFVAAGVIDVGDDAGRRLTGLVMILGGLAIIAWGLDLCGV